MKSGTSVEPEAIDSLTIVFTDIAHWDSIAGKSTPVQIVMLLNDLYSQMDDIFDEYECFKVSHLTFIIIVVVVCRYKLCVTAICCVRGSMLAKMMIDSSKVRNYEQINTEVLLVQ